MAIPVIINAMQRFPLRRLLRKGIVILISLFPALPIFALTPTQINQLVQEDAHDSLTQRISYFSSLFLGAPYQFDALGEGPSGEFDQKPLYRFDSFDCQTYVDTILALAFSHDFPSFQENMLQIDYQNGTPTFFTRNHFPETDWMPNNIQKGFITDISPIIANPDKLASKNIVIDYQDWYADLPISRIYLPSATADEIQQSLALLHQHAKQVKNVSVAMGYIPKAAVSSILSAIPNGAILLIVQPTSSEKAQSIGTSMLVSHMGFAIWDNKILYLRAASSWLGEVVDYPLLPYLKTQKEIGGIMVLMPREQG